LIDVTLDELHTELQAQDKKAMRWEKPASRSLSSLRAAIRRMKEANSGSQLSWKGILLLIVTILVSIGILFCIIHMFLLRRRRKMLAIRKVQKTTEEKEDISLHEIPPTAVSLPPPSISSHGKGLRPRSRAVKSESGIENHGFESSDWDTKPVDRYETTSSETLKGSPEMGYIPPVDVTGRLLYPIRGRRSRASIHQSRESGMEDSAYPYGRGPWRKHDEDS
jgi:hypothetical protein